MIYLTIQSMHASCISIHVIKGLGPSKGTYTHIHYMIWGGYD